MQSTAFDNLTSVFVGIIIGIVVLVTSVSLMTLIFTDGLSQYLVYGTGMALMSVAVSGAIVALTSCYTRVISVPQGVAPILAVMVSVVIATMPQQSTAEDMLITVLITIALTTLITGFFLIGLGFFKIGGLIRFLPLSVIGGYQAGIGWLLIIGAIRVLTNLPLQNLHEVNQLFSAEHLGKWLSGVIIAVLFYIASRTRKYPSAFPLTIILCTASFYIIAFSFSLSIEQLQADGWLLGPFNNSAPLPWSVLVDLNWDGIQWNAIYEGLHNLGTVLVLSVIGIMTAISGLELMNQRDLDVNKELRAAGIANIFIGFLGGIVAFHSFSLSALAQRMGGKNRLVGLTVATVCILSLLSGPEMLSYLPRPILGGLLAYMGIIFLKEWTIDSWNKVPKAEYALIPLILLIIIISGFVAGVVAGLVAAIILFVINYSQIGAVRLELSGDEIKSTVERNPQDQAFLKNNGGRIHILALHGYLFFGSISNLIQSINTKLDHYDGQKQGFLILDFKHVTGIDFSAETSFIKINQLADRHNFQVIYTALKPQFSILKSPQNLDKIKQGKLKLFKDLDHGLEWCEQTILVEKSTSATLYEDSLLQDISGRFPYESKKIFLSYLEQLEVPAGYVLIRQGDSSEDLFFVEKGDISIYLDTDNGNNIRLRRVEEGTVIGEMGFYLHEKRSASVIADTALILYRLSAKSLSEMESKNPDVALQFHRFMAVLTSQRLLLNTQILRKLTE